MNKNKLGVLLVNLGTPRSPSKSDIKRYLKQFLSDRRVIDIPKWIWLPILCCVVLPIRTSRLVKLYKSIWMEQGSPLMVFSERQRYLLEKFIKIPVTLGMNYGKPSIKVAIDKLLDQNINQIIILPLYPQFSSSTVGAVWDAINKIFKNYRSLPTIHFIRDYADHPAYINAIKNSINNTFIKYGEPDLLLISYHGIPQSFVDAGDDYPKRCLDTTIALTKVLSLNPDKIMMTFQSHFGYQAWLRPYTDEIIKNLPLRGIKNIYIISPGFASDCLETLEEINKQNKKLFLKSGGKIFHYIPALNDSSDHIEMMSKLINLNNYSD